MVARVPSMLSRRSPARSVARRACRARRMRPSAVPGTVDAGVEVFQRHRAVQVAAQQHRPEQHERDQHVDPRPRQDHDDAPPRRRHVVRAVGDAEVELLEFQRAHPRDLHVAARRDRADRVVGLAAFDPGEPGREEQREALHAHPDGLRDEEVAELVEHDQRHDPEQRQYPAHRLSVAGVRTDPRGRREALVQRRDGLER